MSPNGNYARRDDRGDVAVYSFDVFDTVFTRLVGTPSGIFLVMQERLKRRGHGLPGVLVNDFFAARKAAESVARKKAQEERRDEICVVEIYAALAEMYRLDETQSRWLMNMEIDVEEEFVSGVPEIVERINRLASQDKRVILLSDMYLRRDDIARLLRNADPNILSKCRLYLSSETGRKKRTGKAFKYVARQEQVEPSEIFHVGDCAVADLEQPRANGFDAELFRGTALTAWEESGKDETDIAWQIRSGIQRRHRLNSPNVHERIGCQVVGPTLVPFVHWVLTSAQEMGLKRLYFVARDGQVLKRIAELAEPRLRTGIDFRYLYGSRQAWNVASIFHVDSSLFEWLFRDHEGLSIRTIGKRLWISGEELRSHLLRVKELQVDIDDELTADQSRMVRQAFERDSQLQQFILEHARNQRRLVTEFLAQEGVTEGVPFAMVDVGWCGNLQDCLFRILNTERTEKVELGGFYWGLRRRNPLTSRINWKLGYCYGPEDYALRNRLKCELESIIEIFTAADHGSVMSYRRGSTGRIEPILDAQGESVRRWGLQDVRRGIDYFAGEYFRLHDGPIDLSKYRDYVLRLLDLTRNPDEDFAQVVGTFPFCLSQEGTRLLQFGGPLLEEQVESYLSGDNRAKREYTHWIEGSIRNSEPNVRDAYYRRTSRSAVDAPRAPAAEPSSESRTMSEEAGKTRPRRSLSRVIRVAADYFRSSRSKYEKPKSGAPKTARIEFPRIEPAKSSNATIVLMEYEKRKAHYRCVMESVEANYVLHDGKAIEWPDGLRADLVICADEWMPCTNLFLHRAKRHGIPILHIPDGILEWRNTYEAPRAAGEENGMPLHQPHLADKIACIGRSQARLMESWGSAGKCEVVGCPRIDSLLDFKPRIRPVGDPFRLLIATARNPAYTPDQELAVMQSLNDLSDWIIRWNARQPTNRIEPIWRLTNKYWEKLGVERTARDLSGLELADILQNVDAAVSTPSTVLLEAMAVGIPTVTLDYTNSPPFSPTAWQITADRHLTPALSEILEKPSPARLLHQEILLHDLLECRTPSIDRLRALILGMLRIRAEATAKGVPCVFPDRMIEVSPHVGAVPERNFDLATLYPNHPVFRNRDLVELQVEVGQLRLRCRQLSGSG